MLLEPWLVTKNASWAEEYVIWPLPPPGMVANTDTVPV